MDDMFIFSKIDRFSVYFFLQNHNREPFFEGVVCSFITVVFTNMWKLAIRQFFIHTPKICHLRIRHVKITNIKLRQYSHQVRRITNGIFKIKICQGNDSHPTNGTLGRVFWGTLLWGINQGEESQSNQRAH